MPAHTCHAVGCSAVIRPRLLMCPRHWKMVPPELQDAVWATYRPGQETRKDPSLEYLEAALAAVNAVASYEASAEERQ